MAVQPPWLALEPASEGGQLAVPSYIHGRAGVSPEQFMQLADMVIVVGEEQVELPCHSQLLARESKVGGGGGCQVLTT